ncbi:hypothetical protein EJB05_47948 [Eragrostis curvula]|uniref:RNA methyltransferase n=1 Tax=Eragrostis curvula TaxID=38414 RepID=A0A5J9T0L2_9POAL|nr:hypothetical protein EJB05_47948 [Eragrostis curvula]
MAGAAGAAVSEDAGPAPSAAKGGRGGADTKRNEGGGGGNRWQKRKRKEVFIYGNYRNYYGYRIDRNVGEDPRLKAFKKEWFEGKDCLDIGCNQGVVTIGLATKFACRSVLGVDIDKGLIETAKWNLRRISREDKVDSDNIKAQESSNSPSQSSHDEMASDTSNGNTCNLKHQNIFEIVSFRCENFVESLDRCSERYDTIMCLSVTKWIHLNWGDDGLITLFVKIWRLLRPGGLFIMEPQPWTSYKRNRQVSEVGFSVQTDDLLASTAFKMWR